ncbi:uncharacterized protein L201_003984 [Kwoniella dendrophila CBS 6074]|uniref:SET domain-containing protein n=1 Tax=Kwoniella dendrophila CBS 6074 TaxID=1295534 RepID=A0AAX4JUF8_9TREE
MERLSISKVERKAELDESSAIALPGEVIYTTVPKLIILNTALLSSHCSGCFKNVHQLSDDWKIPIEDAKEKTLTCSRCNVHTFCSLKCYASNWLLLLQECKGLSRSPGWLPSTIARLLASVLAHSRFNGGLKKMFEYSPGIEALVEQPIDDLEETFEDVIRLIGDSRENDECTEMFLPTSKYHLDSEEDAESFMRLLSYLMRFKQHLKTGGHQIYSSRRRGKLPVTISYIDLCLPKHSRQKDLAMFGFNHPGFCRPCLDTTCDERWAIPHTSCELAGRIPLPPLKTTKNTEILISEEEKFINEAFISADVNMDQYSHENSNEQNVDYDEDYQGTCDTCGELVSVVNAMKRYTMVMEYVGTIWEKEKGGMTLPCYPMQNDAIEEEIAILATGIAQLLQVFSPSVYPIPYLQLRYSRLFSLSSSLSRNIVDLGELIDSLNDSYDSLLFLNDGLPNILISQISLKICELYLDLIKLKKDKISDKYSIKVVGRFAISKSSAKDKSKSKWTSQSSNAIDVHVTQLKRWLETSISHLEILGYNRDNNEKTFIQLEIFQRELEELETWFKFAL